MPDPDDSSEESTLLGRVKRYSGVTTGLAGVALRGVGRWLGGSGALSEGNARDLARMLGGLRGPLMKVAQVAGGLPDILPPEFTAELAKLQSDAPEMGPAFVRRRMAAELGRDWLKRFASFDLKAAHAASLGQVHYATALGGRALACKLQYPDMQSAVDADLTQLRSILALQRTAERRLDTTEIAAEVSERVREELDYFREAAHMRLFRLMLAGRDRITAPEPIVELSTGRLLTMTRLDGHPFREAKQMSEAERNAIARTLFDAWWTPLYRFGVVHGDAHLGNYTIRADGGINLFDFGCVRILPPRTVQGLVDLHHALCRNDDALAAKAYRAWGFAEVTPDFVSKMNVWSRRVFASFLDDRVRTFGGADSLFAGGVEQVWSLKQRMMEGATVRPPREFVFVARAIVGIGMAFVHLKAELNWRRMFEMLIEDFDVDMLAKRQREAVKAADLPEREP